MPAPDDSPNQPISHYDLALKTVLGAGEIALHYFRTSNSRWRKADGTPVSEADLAVNAYLKDAFARATPRYGWRSEESEAHSGNAVRFWLADPIDGTAAFIGGSENWCISLALLEESEPILGIIHAPALEQTFAAARGEGATLNGSPISPSDTEQLAGALILASAAALRAERWARSLPDVTHRLVPSLALRLAQVAHGDCDAALALVHKHDWDLAAGDIIVREAGGAMSDLSGRRLFYDGVSRRNGFIAANPLLHAAILSHGPKFNQQGGNP